VRVNLWLLGILVVLLINLFSLRDVLNNENLWRDSENHDTRTLLKETRKHEDALRWWVNDWPLGNGFYRPIPTMAFLMDDALYHNNLNMYRLTNWFIGLGCALLLVWMVWEIFRDTLGALCCGIVFSLWQSGLAHDLPMQSAGNWLGIALLAFALLPGRGGLWKGIVAASLAMVVGRELSGWLEKMDIVQASFSFRNISWPPGRTATIMALFVIPCVAAYCRWERTRRNGWMWLSLGCLTLGFFTYEQTVVVPAVLIACAVALRLEGVRVRWRFHLIPWFMLFIYAGLHRTYLEDTRYKKQAFRGPKGGWADVLVWLFPGAFEMRFMPGFFTDEIGWLFWLVKDFWYFSGQIVSNFIAYWEARKEWLPAGFGLLVSVGTFLPMAFQHPLAHYHYLPMAFRSIFVTWLMLILWRAAIAAVRRRAAAPETPLPEPS
jgi:hypothetical protein